MRMTRVRKFRKTHRVYFFVSKLVVIYYLCLFSLTYLNTPTDAIFTEQYEVVSKIYTEKEMQQEIGNDSEEPVEETEEDEMAQDNPSETSDEAREEQTENEEATDSLAKEETEEKDEIEKETKTEEETNDMDDSEKEQKIGEEQENEISTEVDE